jgi:hypothetical protein
VALNAQRRTPLRECMLPRGFAAAYGEELIGELLAVVVT